MDIKSDKKTKNEKKLFLMGAGNMGRALLKGIVESGIHRPEDIWVYDKYSEKTQELCEDLGCKPVFRETDTRSDAFSGESDVFEDIVRQVDSLILAVKPNNMAEAVSLIRDSVKNNALIVSIAAGITLAKLEQFFERSLSFCRAMPNTPALIGQGASGLCFKNINKKDKEYCISLFESCSLVLILEEELMDALTAVSGSGPAYAYILIEEMAAAGADLGLDPKDALFLAARTVRGAADLLIHSKEDPAVLTQRVCSPGGTTMAAVEELETGNFRKTIRKAVVAAEKRSKELSE